MARKGKGSEDTDDDKRFEFPPKDYEGADEEGFRDISSAEGGTWAHLEKGAIFRGVLVGRFQKKNSDDPDDPDFFYQLRLTRPAKGRREKQVVDLVAGDILNIDDKTGLSDLRTYAADTKKKWEVIIETGEKRALAGGKKTFWPFKLKGREVD